MSDANNDGNNSIPQAVLDILEWSKGNNNATAGAPPAASASASAAAADGDDGDGAADTADEKLPTVDECEGAVINSNRGERNNNSGEVVNNNSEGGSSVRSGGDSDDGIATASLIITESGAAATTPAATPAAATAAVAATASAGSAAAAAFFMSGPYLDDDDDDDDRAECSDARRPATHDAADDPQPPRHHHHPLHDGDDETEGSYECEINFGGDSADDTDGEDAHSEASSEAALWMAARQSRMEKRAAALPKLPPSGEDEKRAAMERWAQEQRAAFEIKTRLPPPDGYSVLQSIVLSRALYTCTPAATAAASASASASASSGGGNGGEDGNPSSATPAAAPSQLDCARALADIVELFRENHSYESLVQMHNWDMAEELFTEDEMRRHGARVRRLREPLFPRALQDLNDRLLSGVSLHDPESSEDGEEGAAETAKATSTAAAAAAAATAGRRASKTSTSAAAPPYSAVSRIPGDVAAALQVCTIGNRVIGVGELGAEAMGSLARRYLPSSGSPVNLHVLFKHPKLSFMDVAALQPTAIYFPLFFLNHWMGGVLNRHAHGGATLVILDPFYSKESEEKLQSRLACPAAHLRVQHDLRHVRRLRPRERDTGVLTLMGFFAHRNGMRLSNSKGDVQAAIHLLKSPPQDPHAFEQRMCAIIASTKTSGVGLPLPTTTTTAAAAVVVAPAADEGWEGTEESLKPPPPPGPTASFVVPPSRFHFSKNAKLVQQKNLLFMLAATTLACAEDGVARSMSADALDAAAAQLFPDRGTATRSLTRTLEAMGKRVLQLSLYLLHVEDNWIVPPTGNFIVRRSRAAELPTTLAGRHFACGIAEDAEDYSLTFDPRAARTAVYVDKRSGGSSGSSTTSPTAPAPAAPAPAAAAAAPPASQPAWGPPNPTLEEMWRVSASLEKKPAAQVLLWMMWALADLSVDLIDICARDVQLHENKGAYTTFTVKRKKGNKVVKTTSALPVAVANKLRYLLSNCVSQESRVFGESLPQGFLTHALRNENKNYSIGDVRYGAVRQVRSVLKPKPHHGVKGGVITDIMFKEFYDVLNSTREEKRASAYHALYAL